MFDITALGEVLIDFTPAGLSAAGNICFERNPGGAPGNVLVCVSKLGGTAAFMGKVGNDMFGRYLSQVLKDYNIDVSGLKFSDTALTSLAFVQLAQNGDRAFSFYRNSGADTMLEPSELNLGIIENSRVFHYGSLSLTSEPSRSATFQAIKHARKLGRIISYDPNLRLRLWVSEKAAKQGIISALEYANIIKVSEEELEFITGESDLEKGSKILWNEYKTDLLLVTRGPEGCFYRYGTNTGESPSFSQCRAVDTTGAGDAFLGGFVYSMLRNGIEQISQFDILQLKKTLIFSNAVASLCVTKKGAMPAMPVMDEVQELLKTNPV